MGESSSACLVRSFSQPSQERSEGDPLRALTASVSFGRFMNESLAWEKWSSFTHNRYQEEVEKYSRPGSVAEKKAYFEAQFKRAAAKKAAALLEQQNAAVVVSTDMNVTNEINVHSTVDSELTGTSSYVGADEAQREEGDVTNQPIDDSPMEFEFTENGSYGVTEEAQGGEDHLNVTNPNLDHLTTCSELPENSSYVGVEEAQGDDGDNTSAFGSYATHEKSNLELAETENSAEQSYPAENEVKSLDQAENVVVEVNENIVQLKKKKKTQTKNAFMAGDSVLSLKKKPLSSTSRLTNNNESSKLRSRVKPMTTPPLKVSDNRKNGKDLIDKKRSNTKSLQTLIKCSSHKEETNKTLSPILEKIVNSRLVRSVTKTSKDGKVQETSDLASVSGISKRTSETPQRENRKSRTRTKLDQPFCRSDTEKGEMLSYSGNFESINENRNRTCSSTVFSPFSLRSEERAAKRREFFQKLEQKLNTKEAKKQQLHSKQKEKATSSSKVLISRAKLNPSIHHERESFTNQTKKEKATTSSKVLASRGKPNAGIQLERESFTTQTKKEKATSSSKVLASRTKPNATIQHDRESFINQMKKEKATSSSIVFTSKAKPIASIREPSNNQMNKEKATSSSFKALTSRAKPNASIHHERESSSYQMKKEKATSSSFKELTSRAKPNASIHNERESSSYQMKKMPQQPCSPKCSSNPVSEVQDNKSRQPWRLLGKSYGSSKDVKRENNLPNHFPVKGRSHNPKSFIRGSTQENASPNIQVQDSCRS